MDYQTTTVPYLPLFEILAAAQADDTDTHGAEGEQQAAGDAVAEEQGADSEEQAPTPRNRAPMPSAQCTF